MKGLPAAIGDRTVDSVGYIRVKVADDYPGSDRGWVREHIMIAERALGKSLPVEAEVHHFNEDKTDNKNTNLVICNDLSYHRLLHRRQRIVAMGGDPEMDKVCGHCESLKLRTDFHKSRNAYDRLNIHCRECVNGQRRKLLTQEQRSEIARQRAFNTWRIRRRTA